MEQSFVVNKKVRILFDDLGKVLSKVGTITSADNLFVEIETIRGKEIIPMIKILRMENVN